MPPRSPRRPGGRVSRQDHLAKQNRLAIGIFVVVALIVLAVVFALVTSQPAKVDAAGCAADGSAPKAHTLILLDETDSLSPTQIAYARALILAEYRRLQPQEKLTVSFIDADPSAANRSFARCRVRLGKEVSELTGNPELVQRQFKKVVGDELDRFTSALATTPTADKSPILEAVDGVLELPDFGPNVPERRLVILSDMAQNSDQFSQYGPKGGASPLPPAVASALAREELKGVDVRIHYLRRPTLARIQTPQHKAFWKRWFEGQGARTQIGWGLQLVGRSDPLK